MGYIAIPKRDDKELSDMITGRNKSLKPYKCPVCNGKGLVPNGFYLAIGTDTYSTSSTKPEECKSCVNGIVWG